ncbi:MAG: hypothetical protein IKC69_06185 [Clostridia bacterium]|nr:hypothetical protein [Clostridia bacterium]
MASKKLWVLLDEEPPVGAVGEGDTLFMMRKSPRYDALPGKKVYYEQSTGADSVACKNACNAFFRDLPDSLAPLQNSFYDAIFRRLVTVTRQLEAILGEGIQEMILVGGGTKPFFTLHRGEGEGEKLLYRSSWLLAPVLEAYFAGREGLTLRRIGKKSDLSLSLLHFYRESRFLLHAFFAEWKRCLLTKKESRLTPDDPRPIAAVPLVLNLQLRHMTSLLADQSRVRPVYLIPSSLTYDEDFNGDFIRMTGLGPFAFLRELLHFGRIRIQKKDVSFSCEGLKCTIPRRILRRISRTVTMTYRPYAVLAERAMKSLPKKPDFVLTDYTFGFQASHVRALTKKMGIPHYNFQYVAMGRVLLPDLDLADRYYLHTRSTWELYHAHHPSFLLYLPVSGKKHPQREEKGLSVSVFLQPDSYALRYYDALEKLFSALSEAGTEARVVIKPHYRQNETERFDELARRFSFVSLAGKEDSVAKLLLQSDFSMSMTSSVLFESVTLGTPGIILDFDGHDTDFIDRNDCCVRQVNHRARSPEDVVALLSAPEDAKRIYAERREAFLAEFDLVGVTDEVFQ